MSIQNPVAVGSTTSAESQQLALLRLGDRLRPLDTAAAIAAVAAEVCGETLSALRAGYGVLDDAAEHVVITHDWCREAATPSVAGRFRFADFGSFIEDLRRGEVVAIADVSRDPRTAAQSGSLTALGVHALLNVPLMRNGRISGVFLAHHETERHWTADEIAFVRGVADRTWAAIATADALAELRSVNAALERQVAKSTAERNRLWELSADLMLVARFNGEIVAVNPAWQQVLGWEEAEVLGRPLVELVHAEDLSRTEAGGAFLAAGGSLPAFENRYRRRDGGYRWISWSATPGDGVIIAVGRDVTEMKVQAESLRLAEEQLRQSQKMEAVGQLTGGIAHDFNNLLTVISTSIQLLQRPGLAEDRRQRFMGSISTAVSRAAKLTGQLLAFARRQALQPVVFDAAGNIQDIADMVQTLVGSRIALSMVAADGDCLIDVDPGQFDTAVVNMAANARDAMSGAGALSIVTRRVAGVPALRGAPALQGDYVAVSVADTGTGIAADRIDRVFEPFYTTKPVGHGTGLGLSQVFGFAKQSGGEVAVESVLGQGTTFTVYLPLARRAALPADGPDAGGQTPPQPQGRLLVVEDNQAVAAAAEATLVELGYEVSLVHSGQDALALLAQGASSYLAVFSDVMMAPMDGITLAAEISARYPWLPVLLASGYSSVLANAETRAFALLQKPYSVEALGKALRELIAAYDSAERREAAHETARVAALESLDVLDTGAESNYDELTRRAAELFGAPMALISLVDTDRQWFKSRVGLRATETPREHAFCAHAIDRPEEVMVVNDASVDQRFAHNPLVTGDPNIRFYAGAPLITSSGEAIGTLCVLDTRPREIDDEGRAALQGLALEVMRRLEARRDAAMPKAAPD